MKKIIGFAALLFVTIKAMSQDLPEPGEPVPYLGKGSALHRLVYLDLPGDHRPIDGHNYFIWLLIFAMIFILILTLSFAVRAQSIIGDTVKPVAEEAIAA